MLAAEDTGNDLDLARAPWSLDSFAKPVAAHRNSYSLVRNVRLRSKQIDIPNSDRRFSSLLGVDTDFLSAIRLPNQRQTLWISCAVQMADVLVN